MKSTYGFGLSREAELHPDASISPCQFLSFTEKFLVFDEDTVQFERLIGGELATQHHVADMDRIGESCIFS